MTTAAIANRPSAVSMEKAARILILIGPPGCGKGTQARLLTGALGVPSISTGDILREAAAANNEFGGRVRQFMDAGALVPDEIVNQVVSDRIGRGDCASGFILDGYPRTVKQARHLELVLHANRLPEAEAIVFEVHPDLLVDRLAARRYCPLCGRVYNLISAPPAEDDYCDDDSMFLMKRADDEEQVIRERFLAYERATAPLIRYYNGTVRHRVDAAGEIDHVAHDLQAALSA
jgi:adenylate kinase